MKKNLPFIFLIAATSFANSPLNTNGADHQIIFWTFNHQFEQAEKLIEEKISEKPNVPKYYFLKVVTESLKQLAESDQFNFEERFEYRRKKNLELIKYTEEVMERFDDIEMTPENKYYLANLYGYLGRMYALDRSFMSAFNNANKGKDLVRELVEEYPDLYDAYLLLGMFEYYADRLGGVTEFFAGLLGFSGDRTRGLEYLKIAQQKGQLTKPMAEFILGETYFTQEDNPFQAYGYFNLLIKKYPNNKDFYDFCVRILLTLDRLNEAEELINNDENNAVTGYSKSSFLIKTGEYKQAVSLLNGLIDKKDFKWGGAYNHAKLMRAISLLLIDESIPGIEKELDEEQLIIFNEIKNNLPATKKVYQFATRVGRLGIGVKMELPKIDDLPERGYLRSMYEFYTGVYYERYRDGTNAVKVFHNLAEDRSYFSNQSVEYLIHIYKSYKPTEEQLDKLEDIIDDLNEENLKFSFKDLRE